MSYKIKPQWFNVTMKLFEHTEAFHHSI